MHAVLLDDVVVAGVAIADVGIDRYLGKLRGSSRLAHQIQGSPPAFLLDVLYGLIGEIELQNRQFISSKSTSTTSHRHELPNTINGMMPYYTT